MRVAAIFSPRPPSSGPPMKPKYGKQRWRLSSLAYADALREARLPASQKVHENARPVG